MQTRSLTAATFRHNHRLFNLTFLFSFAGVFNDPKSRVFHGNTAWRLDFCLVVSRNGYLSQIGCLTHKHVISHKAPRSASVYTVHTDTRTEAVTESDWQSGIKKQGAQSKVNHCRSERVTSAEHMACRSWLAIQFPAGEWPMMNRWKREFYLSLFMQNSFHFFFQNHRTSSACKMEIQECVV